MSKARASRNSVTHASGTSIAATTTYEYNSSDELIAITDPNKHATDYGYDSTGNKISERNTDGDEKKWTYDGTHDVETETMPEGETTTIKRNSHGDPEVIERPAPGSTTQKYNAANNPTEIEKTTYAYNAADELENSVLKKATAATYAYNELGERTKTTPSAGPATTYGYDQAGSLISVERPEKESVPKIEDAYAYNGEGLRASQTISGTASYLAWGMAEELPLILSDGTNSYIYGPGGLPVEQISSGGTATYLHHDQQGSTRLLTGSTGTVTDKCTYGAYGAPTCEGTATTPLGYDGRYTNSDTGLIYMRARTYDPAPHSS